MSEARTTYSVVAERPGAVRDHLQRIWRENLTLSVSPEERFRWLYEDAPDAVDRVFILRARDGDGNERVVGTKGVALRRYSISGRDARAGLSGDFAVEVMHRHLTPALQLARTAREYVQEQFDIGYGLPNDKATPVMLRAGFRLLGKTSRYVRVLRHAAYAKKLARLEGIPPVLARVAASPVVAPVAGFVADVTRLAQTIPRFARAALKYELEWCERPDSRFDSLWTSARVEYPVVGARTSAFLAWRYPAGRLAALASRRGGLLRAYAVIEKDETSGAAHVRDLFGHREDLGALLDRLLAALWGAGHTSVSVRFMGAPLVARLLVERGFKVRGEGRAVVVQVGDRAAANAAAITTAENWHLFDIDEDS